jgi:hypothetical protein
MWIVGALFVYVVASILTATVWRRAVDAILVLGAISLGFMKWKSVARKELAASPSADAAGD